MTVVSWALLTAWMAFLIFMLVHVAFWRLARGAQGILAIAALALAAFTLAIFGLKGAAGLPLSGHLLVSGPMFALLMVLYLHLYAGVNRSVSLRIMGELRSGGLTRKALALEYPADGMFRHRVDLLCRRHWLNRSADERLTCTAFGRRVARWTGFLQRFYGLSVSG